MKTFIFGAGGHGKVVLDILKAQGVVVDGFIESKPKFAVVCGLPVVPETSVPNDLTFRVVVAVGANHSRRDIVQRLRMLWQNVEFINAIHPSAYISSTIQIGVGNVIAAGAIVASGSAVGNHAVVNTGAQVDHDCLIEDFATVAPGVVLGGGVRIGTGTYVAIGAVVKHGVAVGEWSVLGAGALVLGEMPSRVVAFGSPCKVVRSRNENDPYL